ncbi:hypothetical protein [Bradyrhizobium sp.]|jgi:hypothetical protein|uniref:ATP-grasp domain-containing protein n=1 Tax=Bradyrhizobium sp. TaxID=376 RepID=UPI002E04FD9F|nr:hypothetical protein [Bradyrhizobium sp.]
MKYFVSTARGFGAKIEFFDLGRMTSEPWRLTVPVPSDDRLGDFRVPGDFSGIYCRPIDLSAALPENQSRGWLSSMRALSVFLACVPITVVNRPGSASHNSAKPLHSFELQRLGFDVAPSITSSDPARLRAFVAEQGDVVLKAVSGMRANTRLFKLSELASFEPASGPIHLQRLTEGHDVRAHVVGETVVAEATYANGIDYRLDREARREAIEIPDRLRKQLVRATRKLGLQFAGWDFKVSGEKYWCLEANPMPGYNYYDQRLDGRITRALVSYLN